MGRAQGFSFQRFGWSGTTRKPQLFQLTFLTQSKTQGDSSLHTGP